MSSSAEDDDEDEDEMSSLGEYDDGMMAAGRSITPAFVMMPSLGRGSSSRGVISPPRSSSSAGVGRRHAAPGPRSVQSYGSSAPGLSSAAPSVVSESEGTSSVRTPASYSQRSSGRNNNNNLGTCSGDFEAAEGRGILGDG